MTYNVFDADVHLHEDLSEMAPFCEEPWRRALGNDTGPERWLDTPGYSPLTQLDPLLSDDPAAQVHMVRTAVQMRADLDRRGVDAALMIPDRFIGLAQAQDADYATSIAAAYNRYLCERWVDAGRGLYGALLVPGQDPVAAVGEIEAYAGGDGFAAVLFSTVHTYPLYGDRSYDRIYAAAQAAGMPVVLHGATTYGTVFPYQLQDFESPLARGGLAQPLGAIANLTSMVTTGVLARFPELKVLFCESGLAWLPFVSSRLDGQYRYLRESAPELAMRPSEYIRRQVWTTSHPLADLEDPAVVTCLVEAIGSDRVVYGSDFPHFDQDDPGQAARLLPAPVLAANARSLFGLKRSL